jgi:hypothetical protein
VDTVGVFPGPIQGKPRWPVVRRVTKITTEAAIDKSWKPGDIEKVQ